MISAPHCLMARIRTASAPVFAERDRAAARDLGRLPGLEVHTGARLTLHAGLLRRLRQAFAARQIRSACAGCEWRGFCNAITASRFDGAVLIPPC